MILPQVERLQGATPPRVCAEAAISGHGGLRFDRSFGVAMWWLPVDGDTPYIARASVRGGAAKVDPPVGRVVLFEMARPPARLSDQEATDAILRALTGPHEQHVLLDENSDGGHVRQSALFRTSSLTHSLLVLVIAGMDETAGSVRAGSPVDFDDLSIGELPLRSVLATDLAPAAPAIPDVKSDPSPFFRQVELEGDLRRAFLVPPPGELRVPLHLPEGRFRLEFAYGVVREARSSWGRTPVEFSARLKTAGATTEVDLHGRGRLSARERNGDCGWQECRFEGVGRGQDADLILSARSSGEVASLDLAAFAEPTLVPIQVVPSRGRNVLLISVDTLRADHVGALGYARGDGISVTPQLDEFARECLVFEQARSLAPYTLPSHVTLLTGLHPVVHGVERYEAHVDASRHPLLARKFGNAGYATVAFTAGGFLGPASGLQAGFDRYCALDPFLPADDPFRNVFPRHDARAFNDEMFARCQRAAIEEWLARHRDERFFAFVHTYVVHNYAPPADVRRRFSIPESSAPSTELDQVDRTRDLYDAAIFTVDREIGGLLRSLRTNGLLDQTIVAITADHGEELADHGGFGHGKTLHDEILRVPLLLRIPGVPPQRIAAPVKLDDVAPTLLAAAGLPSIAEATGIDLTAALRSGDWPDEWSASLDDPRLGKARALGVGGMKLVESRGAPTADGVAREGIELFDLVHDPKEASNLLSRNPTSSEGNLAAKDSDPAPFVRLRQRIAARFLAFERAREAIGVDPASLLRRIDDATRQELHALGYLSEATASER